jgi:hypothetical protein
MIFMRNALLHGGSVDRRRSVRFLLRILVLSLALQACGCAGASDLHDFTSDGCSLFPDGSIKDRTLWCECCFAHDIAYWRGGTAEERKQADKALQACVRERTGDKALADLMYNGVRAGGHPAFPTWYRWGYGWKYGRGYRPLTPEEQPQVDEKLKTYRKKHPFGYCREKQ